MTLVKGNVRIGVHTRFGPNWPGKRCLAKTRRGTACQRAAYKHNGRCALHGGRATGPRTQRGLQRISRANLRHGRQIKKSILFNISKYVIQTAQIELTYFGLCRRCFSKGVSRLQDLDAQLPSHRLLL